MRVPERAEESRLKLWLLLSVNRWILTGALAACVFGSLVVLGEFGPSSIRTLIEADVANSVFQSMTVAVMSVVSFALIIGQLTVTQANAPLDDFRERMEGTMTFRQDIEELTDVVVSPAAPSIFLTTLIGTARNRADELEDAIADNSDQQLREQVHAYVDDLVENTERISSQLQRAQFGTFEAHKAMLDYKYSRHIYAARRIRSIYPDSLSAEAKDTLDELVTVLMFFGAAREHFQTTYFQWELVDLSRGLVYTGVPAVTIAAYMAFLFDASAVPDTTLAVSTPLLVVSAAFSATIVPFLLLLTYIVRILTAAKRTLAIGPFILWERTGSGRIGWDE